MSYRDRIIRDCLAILVVVVRAGLQDVEVGASWELSILSVSNQDTGHENERDGRGVRLHLSDGSHLYVLTVCDLDSQA